MDQPVPKVTAADVERIVRRDFPAERYDEVMGVLRRYGTVDYEREPDRVRLAILKLAGGDFSRLEAETQGAKSDYRDTLLAAEYPLCAKKMFHAWSDAERQEVYARDWEQYRKWLERPDR